MRTIRDVVVSALVLVLTCTAAWAQATAELNGRVTDESGAVLPGVTVTVTQTDTGLHAHRRHRCERHVRDAEPADRPVQAGGRRCRDSARYVQTGIVLQVGATPTINVVLGVGNLEETVSVEARGAARRRPQRRHQRRSSSRSGSSSCRCRDARSPI